MCTYTCKHIHLHAHTHTQHTHICLVHTHCPNTYTGAWWCTGRRSNHTILMGSTWKTNYHWRMSIVCQHLAMKYLTGSQYLPLHILLYQWKLLPWTRRRMKMDCWMLKCPEWGKNCCRINMVDISNVNMKILVCISAGNKLRLLQFFMFRNFECLFLRSVYLELKSQLSMLLKTVMDLLHVPFMHALTTNELITAILVVPCVCCKFLELWCHYFHCNNKDCIFDWFELHIIIRHKGIYIRKEKRR